MERKDQNFIIGVVLMVGGIIIITLSIMIHIHFAAILGSVPFMRETEAIISAGRSIYYIMPIGVVMFGLGGITTLLNLKSKEKI